MTTLKNLSSKMGIINIEEKIINVGNKYDLQNNFNEPILKVSAVNETGIKYMFNNLNLCMRIINHKSSHVNSS